MSEWIEVTPETMPEPGTVVLLGSDFAGPSVHTGFLTLNGKWYASPGGFQLISITHWQPLPAPPPATVRPVARTST